MNIWQQLTGRLPYTADDQKAACIAELEPVMSSLIERGAYPGVIIAALTELLHPDAGNRRPVPRQAGTDCSADCIRAA
jgi:hypothetical protein